MDSLQHTEDQRRAQSAWKCVDDIKKKDEKKLGPKYRALVRGAAGDIMTNGLSQTLAFLLAKAKGKTDNEHGLLYGHLAVWISNPEQTGAARFTGTGLMEWLMKQDSDTYRLVTFEVVTYLNWLKRFAEASLKEEVPVKTETPAIKAGGG